MKCSRDDLRVVIPQPTEWTVDGHGNPDIHVADGSFYDMEQYSCKRCGQCFAPGDPSRVSEWDSAWRAALEHTGAAS